MEEIKKKLIELIGICETKVKKCDADTAINSAKAAKLAKKEKDAEASNKLAQEGIERLNALNEKHEDLAKAKKLKETLQSEIKRYKSMQEELQKEIDAVEDMKKQAMDEVEFKREKLAKDIESLNQDRKTYEAKVMKAIELKLKKKGIEL